MGLTISSKTHYLLERDSSDRWSNHATLSEVIHESGKCPAMQIQEVVESTFLKNLPVGIDICFNIKLGRQVFSILNEELFTYLHFELTSLNLFILVEEFINFPLVLIAKFVEQFVIQHSKQHMVKSCSVSTYFFVLCLKVNRFNAYNYFIT